MAQSYRNRFLGAQRQNEAALKALYAQLADAIGAELTRRADADGNIPRSATFDIQQAAGDLVRRLFLGRNRNGEWAPFDTLPNGTVIPLSPYMRQMWDAIRTVVRIPVEQNAAVLTKRLPADVAYVMQRATLNPFVVAKGKVSEQVFRPNPLAAYEAPHTWVDPNGYRLSDRVWNAATLTRRQIDAYMEEGIREGKGALQMSRELRQFLTPGESLRKTDRPYGTSASFSGMRLARTEITRASNEAHRTSAAMNPFVSGMKWNLSARHPKIDICDDYARGGKNGDGVYAIEDYPSIPHPQCLCRSSNVIIEDPDAVLAQLRADIQAAKQEFVNLVGPVEVDRFTKLLLGQGLEEVRVAPGATRVIAPPVIAPPVVPPPTPPTPPPVVVQPVVPAFDPDDPAQVRQRILEIGRATRRRSDEIEEQIITMAQELTAIERRMRNLAGRDLEAARREYTAKSAAATRLQTEQNQLNVDLQRQYRDLTSVRDPAQVRIPAGSPANWQEGVADFNRLVSRSVITDTDPTFVQMAPGGRGYYDALRRRISVAVDDKARTITHELGHWLEETNPDILRQALAFHDRRTVGYNEEWLGPGYPVTETTKKDKFLHEYMGKTYGRDATEIVSMGIEWMHLRPAELAARDPDMFDFIFNLARGKGNTASLPASPVVAPVSPRSPLQRLLSADVPKATLEDHLQQIFRDFRAAKEAGNQSLMDDLRSQAAAIKEKMGEPAPATNARPAATPAPSPTAGGPTSLVSEHLELRAFGDKVKESFDASVGAINAAHGDGGLGPITVEKNNNLKTAGAYRPRLGDRAGRVTIDYLFGVSERANYVLIHEIGHYIDDYMDLWDEGLQTQWAGAVAQTPTYKYLKDRAGDRYVDYLLDRRELWARSYTQYVATRSKNTDLLEWLDRHRAGGIRYPEEWPDDEFEPIAKAIDGIFKKLGWL